MEADEKFERNPMLVEILDEDYEVIEHRRAYGLELDPHPFVRPWEWGEEAKHGLSIFWNINTFCCPTCGKRIVADMVHHKPTGDEDIPWTTTCVFCDPKGKTAL